MKILITGAQGMFGLDAVKLFADSGYGVIAAGKSDLDVTDVVAVRTFLAQHPCDVVLHAAAYTKVDDAETNQELAFLINRDGAKNVAIATREQKLPMIFISTDYVFDGEKHSPYLPADKTNPINVYGASKLAGELEVQQENPQHYVVRTSWLYGKNGKNFVDTMIVLSQQKSQLKVVDDQFGCPTWTVDLAAAIKDLIERKSAFGTYQFCGSGVVSWCGFAKEIFKIIGAKVEVIPVTTDEFPRPAKRPKFSAMENNNALRAWQEALSQYLSTSTKF